MTALEKSIGHTCVSPIISVTADDLAKKDVLVSVLSSDGKEIHVTTDVDQAMGFAIQHEHEIVFDEEKDRKLLRKIDMYLLPIMVLLYCFQFMDKTSTSMAAIMGMREDLKMTGDKYSWVGSAFYLGYLAFEYPAVRILQRFPVAKTVASFIIIWGTILCLHAVPKYPGFLVLRTLLGMFESAVTPAFVIITGQYYRKEETFVRTAIWFASNGLGTIIGSGAIGYNLAVNADSYSLEAWKLVFIITGVLTIALGIIIMVHVPDDPTGAWWLNEEEKLRVIERIRVNQQGFGNKHFKFYQFKEALTDIKTWLFFCFSLCQNIPNGGLTNFGTVLLSEDMGFTSEKALLMQMPGGAVEFVGCIALALCSRWVKSRMFIAVFGTVVTLVACCMLAFGKSVAVRYAGLTLEWFLPIGTICLLSNISSNVAGHTKKTTVNAIFLIGYCVGNLIGPQTFIATEAPSYRTAQICIVAFMAMSIVTLLALWFCYWYENKKKDKYANLEEARKLESLQNHEFADLTDKENLLFRYEL